MPWIASFALVSLSLAVAPPTPTPTPTEGPNLPSIPISVKVVRSRAAEVRAASSGAVQCEPLPMELARPAEPPIPSHVPRYTSIAGTGKTLGILYPKTEKGHPLSLFTRGRPSGSYVLKPPPLQPSLPPSPPLSLGEEGSFAALVGREGFAVYVNGVLTGVFDQDAHTPSVAFRADEVMWCPWPRSIPVSRPSRLSPEKLYKEGEEPPLWFRAELDGASPEVLARVDLGRLDPEYPHPSEWAMGIAARRDGKLWLVGLCSGEVWLASASGRILRREVLPVRLRSEEEDEKSIKKLEEEILEEERSQIAAWGLTKRQPKSAKVHVTARIRVIDRVMARGNDLVVTSYAMDPARAVIYIPADGGLGRCWTVPGQGWLSPVAVTDEALWWLGGGEGEGEEVPLLHILWDQLLAPEASSEEKPQASASPGKP